MQSFPLLASRLSGLTPDLLACVLDALTLVRLGWTEAAELRGYLSDDFLVRALDDDLRRNRGGKLDALRRLVFDSVRESKRELQSVGTRFSLVSDADDVELLRETLRDALDHVGDERAREAVERLVLRVVARAIHGDRAALLGDQHVGRNGPRELALRSLYSDTVSVDGDGDAGWNRDRIL